MLWDFLASPPFHSAVSQSLHPPVSTRHVYESLPLFSTPHPLFLLPLSLSNVYSSAKEASGEGGSPHFRQTEEGGGFGICRDSDRRKERLLSPPISQCNKMRQLPQNSVEFIFFCWKLGSGHLNARAEGSRKGEKEEARILSPSSPAKRRVAAPSAVGGEGAIEQAGAVQEGGRRRRKKTLFCASFTCAYDDDSVLVGGERREEERDIFPLLSRFPQFLATNIRWKTKCRLYPTTLHIYRRLLLFVFGDITQAGEKVLFLFLCGACVYVCRKGEEKEEILLRRRRKKKI